MIKSDDLYYVNLEKVFLSAGLQAADGGCLGLRAFLERGMTLHDLTPR